MWVEFPCFECNGEGVIKGIASEGPNGEYYEGLLDCYACNADRVQMVWMDSCRPCGGSGKVEGGVVCTKCKGFGYHSPEKPPMVSYYENIE